MDFGSTTQQLGWGGAALPVDYSNGNSRAPWFGRSRKPQASRPPRGSGGHGSSSGSSGSTHGGGTGGPASSGASPAPPGGPNRGGGGGGGGGASTAAAAPPYGLHGDAPPIEDAVATLKRLPRGDPIPERVLRALLSLDSRGASLLLKDLSKAGLDDRAIELFDRLRALPERHPLRALCDVYTYTAMISLCIYQQNVDRAMELLAEMRARGVERNVHTFTALMNVCIKCGRMGAALDIFDAMRAEGCCPNVVTYNTLIDVHGKLGQWDRAVAVLKLMRSEGVVPALRTFNTLIIACNMCNQPREALAVHQELLAEGFTPNSTTYNALISAYGKLGQLDKVLEVYKDMVWKGLERSVITYSSLISACEKAGRWETALQLFDEMTRDGCAPNTVTYNSLITACGQGCQWEKAQAVFDQMSATGCTPDVVTYTSLISAYERSGQWHLALQAFQRMLAQGCRPDGIVYNAIIDALWQTGAVWAQAKALDLYHSAVKQGHLRPHRAAPAGGGAGGSAAGDSPQQPSGGADPAAAATATGGGSASLAASSADGGGGGGPAAATGSSAAAAGGGERWELNLHALTAGVAMISLHLWLNDVRDQVSYQGEGSLPASLAIVTDAGSSSREQGNFIIKEAVATTMAFWGAPFRPVQDRAYPGMLEAPGPAVAQWVLSDGFGALMAALMPSTAPAPGGPSQLDTASVLEREGAARAQCCEAFAAVARFEATHSLQLCNMGPGYLGQRTALVSSVLEAGSALSLPDEAVHDAVLLMDRAMSAAPGAPPELLPLLAGASLHIAASPHPSADAAAAGAAASGAAGAGDGPASAEAVAAAMGLDAGSLSLMAWRVRQLLGGDTVAISALRCLKLYLERMGYRYLDKRGIYAMAGLPVMLAVEALFDMGLLNCRPSAVAAAVLYAERRQRGAVPFWPSMLGRLTGYEDLASPELAVAVHTAQKLCRKVLYTQIYRTQAAGLAGAAASGTSAQGAAAAPVMSRAEPRAEPSRIPGPAAPLYASGGGAPAGGGWAALAPAVPVPVPVAAAAAPPPLLVAAASPYHPQPLFALQPVSAPLGTAAGGGGAYSDPYAFVGYGSLTANQQWGPAAPSRGSPAAAVGGPPPPLGSGGGGGQQHAAAQQLVLPEGLSFSLSSLGLDDSPRAPGTQQ